MQIYPTVEVTELQNAAGENTAGTFAILAPCPLITNC